MQIGSRKAATAGITLLGLLASGSVLAQAAPGERPRSSLGLAVVAQKSPYAGYDTDVLPAPVINYEGKKFHFRGGSIGYTLFDNAKTEVSLLAKYSYPIPTGKVVLIPGVGVNYASSALNDYYFGISADEAQRSGLARYKADSGVAPYMDVTALMPLGAHWTATASLRRTLLSSAVKDSPMTRGDHMDTALLALTYGF